MKPLFMDKKFDLTHGSISNKLFRLTVPMVFGLFSMVVFNLVDTFFISRLGTQKLAAMGFTFPVVMLVVGVSLGLGVATSSIVSRAIGRGDRHQVQRLTTDSLFVSILVVIALSILGFFTMDWMFRLLGADQDILVLIKQYMVIWYLGVSFVVVPMVGNNAIRASGDTFLPGVIMVISMILNVILDPILIFGLWIFPRLELAGAALATIVSRALSLVISLYVLHYKKHLLDLSFPSWAEFKNSLRQIFYIGIPSAASRILLPVAMAIIMRLVSRFGAPAVAAVGVAIRIEMFVFVAIMALAAVLIPFIGQNWGARKFDRVKDATKGANIFSIYWGLGFFILFLFLAPVLGDLFSKDPLVSRYITYFLWIVPFSYGLKGASFLAVSVFNAVNKPYIAIFLNLARIFAFYIPFALAGALLGNLVGLFAGLGVANLAGGILALFILHKKFALFKA